jgi:Holliday junction resolvase RusA-like endonuclease
LERPTKKPDLDNLAKSVLDGLNGVVYLDDSQLVSLHITKVYDHSPGVDIMVREELP